MPKIPLYGEKIDATPLATGSLGPRAAIGAFTAPGRATAGFAKAAGDIAFQFGQMEKKLTTDRVASEYESEAQSLSADYRIGLQETDTQAAADGLKTIEDKLLGRVDGMNLTRSQKQAVTNRVRRKFASEYTNVKSKAFNNHIRITSAAENESLALDQSRLATLFLAGDKTFNEDLASSHSRIDAGRQQGLNINYTKASFNSGYVKEVVSAVVNDPEGFDLATFERVRKVIGNSAGTEGMTFGESKTYLAALDRAKDEYILAKRKDAKGQIFQSNLSSDEFDSAIEELRNPDATQIVIPREDGDIVIDVAEIPSDERAVMASNMRSERSVALSVEQTEMLEAATSDVQSASLSTLNQNLQDAQAGTGIAEGMELGTRARLESSIREEIREREPRVNQTIETNTTAIKNTVVDNGGDLSAVEDIVEQTRAAYDSLGTEGAILGDKFESSLVSITTAAGAYKTVRYGKDADIKAARADLKDRERAETDPAKRNQITAAITTFDEMIATRREALANDAVGFLNAEHRRDTQDDRATLSRTELVTKQRAMGIPENKIRIISNDEVSTFRAGFDGLTSYNDKSQFALEFLSEKSEGNKEDERRIFRNLVEAEVLSLTDQMIIANPNNANMFSVDAANTEESLAAFKQNFTETKRRELAEAVRNKNTNYSGSLVGGSIEGAMPQGATSARMAHVGAMNQVVANTAMYYMMIDNGIDMDEAVDKAIDTVIDSQFSFATVNDKPIRFKKGFEPYAETMGRILEANLSRGIDVLKEIVVAPPGRRSETEEVRALRYATDISQNGYWVTTTDNSGAFLVDQDGNMIPRKIDAETQRYATDVSAQDRFIYVKFDDLLSTAEDVIEIESSVSLVGDQRMKEIRNLINKRVF